MVCLGGTSSRMPHIITRTSQQYLKDIRQWRPVITFVQRPKQIPSETSNNVSVVGLQQVYELRCRNVVLIHFCLVFNYIVMSSNCYVSFNPVWLEGRGNKKCHNFWKANGIDLKFYVFS